MNLNSPQFDQQIENEEEKKTNKKKLEINAEWKTNRQDVEFSSHWAKKRFELISYILVIILFLCVF